MLKKYLKVDEFARQLGVPKHIVRRWDTDGIFMADHRMLSGGARKYSWDQVGRARDMIQRGVLSVDIRKS